MDDQEGRSGPVADGSHEIAGTTGPGTATTPGQAPEPPAAAAEEGKDGTMTQYSPMTGAPVASLTGSLSEFTLADVLALLAVSGQTGELRVDSEPVRGKLWLVDGDLANGEVGSAVTIGQAVFELACVTEGTFFFTVGVTAPSSQPAVSVEAVLDDVRPQVDEWRDIRRVVPFDAPVVLAPVPPNEDVRIRSDQWQVLSTVGRTGHTIRSVLEEIGGDQMEGLRTLRDLAGAGLITVGDHTEGSDGGEAPLSSGQNGALADITALPLPPEGPPVEDVVPEGLASVPAPPVMDSMVGLGDEEPDSLAAVAIMPPPIAGDPWTPVPEPTATSDNGVA